MFSVPNVNIFPAACFLVVKDHHSKTQLAATHTRARARTHTRRGSSAGRVVTEFRKVRSSASPPLPVASSRSLSHRSGLEPSDLRHTNTNKPPSGLLLLSWFLGTSSVKDKKGHPRRSVCFLFQPSHCPWVASSNLAPSPAPSQGCPSVADKTVIPGSASLSALE